jgi:hypothetical protein
MTWMRQPSRQGTALFSVRIEFWRSTTGSEIPIYVTAVSLLESMQSSPPIGFRNQTNELYFHEVSAHTAMSKLSEPVAT